jgi:hypothetical protein
MKNGPAMGRNARFFEGYQSFWNEQRQWPGASEIGFALLKRIGFALANELGLL